MISKSKYQKIIFKTFAIFLGLFLALLLLELSLRVAGGILITKGKKDNSMKRGELIIFSGDSWTFGCDVKEGESFYDLLKKDNDFKKFSLVNVAYGGNNPFQIVSAIIKYRGIPVIIIVNMGINNWHLMGFEEFVKIAEDYFSANEIIQLRKNFKLDNQWSWIRSFKIYKLFLYIAGAKKNKDTVDLKMFENCLGSKLLWDVQKKFTEKYSDDFNGRLKALPIVLKETRELSLDQKFYLTSLNLGFHTRESEEVLRKADLFYPEKLSVISYDVYRKIGIQKKQLGDTRILFMKWAFKLLKKWAMRNNVTVFVQTYPDIKNTSLGDNSYVNINKLIKAFVWNNGFKVIDHNINSIDWVKYRTSWHVNNDGHRLMKDIIKSNLMNDSYFLELARDVSINKRPH